jgi:hypothetical protein
LPCQTSAFMRGPPSLRADDARYETFGPPLRLLAESLIDVIFRTARLRNSAAAPRV